MSYRDDEEIDDSEDVYDRRPRTSNGQPGPVQGWSASNEYIVNSILDNPEDNGAFNLQAEFQHLTYYTIQFSISLLSITTYVALEFPQQPGSLRGIAEIHWTVKGNHHVRRIHVTNGSVISGSGESVWVKFIDQSDIPEGEFNVIGTFVATVSIVTGTRPNAANSQPPMFLQETAFITSVVGGVEIGLPAAAGAGVIFQVEVPDDHGINAFMINVSRPPPDNATVILINDVVITQEGPSGTIVALWGGEMTNKFVPLFPGTTLVSMQNVSAVDLTFGMVWGVEG